MLLLIGHATARGTDPEAQFRPTVPKMWEDAAMADLELPLAHAAASPRNVPAEFYYRIPVRPIHKSYPVYHPDREPPGYLEHLRTTDPVLLWDERQGIGPVLGTEADWIEAGRLVFQSPIITGSGRLGPTFSTNVFTRDSDWYAKVRPPLTPEGVLPFYRYVIRERGKIEIGILSCAMCHTRVMPDGTLIEGAQGNFPFDRAFANDIQDPSSALELNRRLQRMLYSAPWVRPDAQESLNEATLKEIALPHSLIPPGALARHRSSPLSPVQVPDLIGSKTRRYFDHSGLQQHRGIADLMRYAALNQGGDDLASFGDFIPYTAITGASPVPEQAPPRYSDQQLYALALYVYSLKPPLNPNLPKSATERALVERGAQLFHDSANRCATCHVPEQGYTNNKLIAAPGYEPPRDHPASHDIMRAASGAPRRIGTDPTLTLKTRRGTGFYKVPSLLGVWYRGPFEHNGSCATLEDWFDPRRLRDDYVPTGWKGPPGTKTRAVQGHEFGLDLSEDERKALIAFLKTL